MTQDRTSGVAWAEFDGASTMDLSGRCVGSAYILQHPIGQGATGTVWRGLDRASGEAVAVKLLHESLLRQPKLVTRFVQERTILLMLRHRNVVRVRDLFSVGETLGLVMDLVDGGSLRDHLRERRTLAAGEAARLSAQVAAALAEAHGLGVVHRDLKPDNILLQREQGRLETRLTDFGVARILNTPSMTTPSAVVGTPHYMAPEAFHGTTASPATDVYALGVLVYELVTGRPPYESDSIPDLMRRHMEGDPVRPAGVPDAIWGVIVSCMATKPRLRPSAAEVVAQLSDAARACADAPALPAPEPADEWARESSWAAPRQGSPRHGCRDLAEWDSVSLAGGAVRGRRGSVSGDGGGLRVGAGGQAERDVVAGQSRRGLGRAGGRAALDEVSQWDVVPAGSTGDVEADAVPHDPDAGADVGDPGGREANRGARGREMDRGARGRRMEHGAQGRDMEHGARGPEVNRGARGLGELAVRRGGRPGRRRKVRWGALIAGIMVASAVVATVWDSRREPRASEVVAAPSGTPVTRPSAVAPARNTRRAAASPGAGVSPSPLRQGGTVADRRGATSPVRSKKPQPEAKPYGSWQCSPAWAVDFRSGTPLGAKPCRMLGRDIRYQGSLIARGGATGSITVALLDAVSGRAVGRTKTCGGLVFGGDPATVSCGPVTANPPRGRRYAVVMSYRYERNGRSVASTSKGSVFAW